MDIVSVDYLGLFPAGQRGMKYLFVCVDNFTKYVWIYPVRSANTSQSIRSMHMLIEEMDQKSNQILCVNGTAFTSINWEKYIVRKVIKLMYTSIKHPQCNMAERLNRDIVTYLRIIISQRQNAWVSKIDSIKKHN